MSDERDPVNLKARREGAEAFDLGMGEDSNPYTDPPGTRYGPQWHWNDAWWQSHCDVQERRMYR